jgi:transcriptional regulator with XRE-family HTH domain
MEQRHPFKEIRVANRLGQEQVANQCRLTQQVVLRTEQGLYGMPSPSLLRFLASLEYSKSVDELRNDYKAWQTQHRLYSKVKIEQALLRQRAVAPKVKFTLPQLKNILGCSSSIGFCKLMCVHPSQVNRYTKRGGSLFFLEEALRDVISEDLVQWVISHLTPA